MSTQQWHDNIMQPRTFQGIHKYGKQNRTEQQLPSSKHLMQLMMANKAETCIAI
jgi:hypothetical protein